MRLKTALWIAAYLRRCQVEGIFGAVIRRGAEDAGAIFVRVNRLDGTSDGKVDFGALLGELKDVVGTLKGLVPK